MQSDPSKKGIVGLLYTDIRAMPRRVDRPRPFVQGAIEDVGRIVASIEEARRRAQSLGVQE